MIRIILLRLLIASWMIPATWTVVFVITYLLVGYSEAKNGCIELTNSFWNGNP